MRAAWDPNNQLVRAYPPFGIQIELWMTACWEDKGLDEKPYVFEIHRSPERQDELYIVGRRGVAGEKIRTKAKAWYSLHQYGCGSDIVKDGQKEKPGLQALWADRKWYKRLADIAREASPGIDWSGDWIHFQELCHFENRFGLTIPQFLDVHKRVQSAFNSGGMPQSSVGQFAEQRLRALYDQLDDQIALVDT